MTRRACADLRLQSSQIKHFHGGPRQNRQTFEYQVEGDVGAFVRGEAWRTASRGEDPHTIAGLPRGPGLPTGGRRLAGQRKLGSRVWMGVSGECQPPFGGAAKAGRAAPARRAYQVLPKHH